MYRRPRQKSARAERYFHFDSWRVNAGGALWVPAQIYVEEEATLGAWEGARYAALQSADTYLGLRGGAIAKDR